MKILFLITTLLVNLIFVQSPFCTEIVCPASETVKLRLELSQDPISYEKQKNIFTIHVQNDIADECKQNIQYNISYYLDDTFLVIFENQYLPFSFSRNLRGQIPGTHIIRIDIEDIQTKKVIASASINAVVASISQ